jgi:hypothetical protein
MVEGRLQVDLGSVCFILLAQITAKKRKQDSSSWMYQLKKGAEAIAPRRE